MADINKLKNKARREEQRQNWTGAIELYKKALLESERDRDGAADLSLFNRIGDIHLRLGDKRQAVQFYEQAIERYADQDLHTSAIALCNKVLRILPDRLETYRQLGRLQASSGLAADARANYLHYASEMIRSGRTDRALEALEESAEATGDQEAALRLAGLFVELDRVDEAVGRLEGLRDRLRERGAKVDRLEARLAALGAAAAGPEPAEAEPVAEEPVTLEAAAEVPVAEEPVPAEAAAEVPVAEEPVPAEPARAAAGTEASDAMADLEAELVGIDEAAPRHDDARAAIRPVRFHAEGVEAAAGMAVEAGRVAPGGRPVSHAEGAEPSLSVPSGAEHGQRVERPEAAEGAAGLPSASLESGLPGTEPAEAPAGPTPRAPAPAARANAGGEPSERMAGGALQEAMQLVARRLGRPDNGAARRSETTRPSPASPDRFSFSARDLNPPHSPEIGGALDDPEPLAPSFEFTPSPAFVAERPEAPTVAGTAAFAQALLTAEELETDISSAGAALIEEGRAARADGRLAAAEEAFEAALACPDSFVEAYGLLRECQAARAAEAEAAALAAEKAAAAEEAAAAAAAEEAAAAAAAEEAAAAAAAEEAESKAAAEEAATAAAQEAAAKEAAEAKAVEPAPAEPRVEPTMEAMSAPQARVEPLMQAPVSDTGDEREASPAAPKPEIDLGTVVPGSGSEGDAGEGADVPTDEFRQWVRTAPQGLLERSLRELQARGELKKAGLVSDRLRELAPEPSGSAVTQVESAREPRSTQRAEGDAMQHRGEGIEGPGARSRAGGTELLEPAGTTGEVPLPYDRLSGDAPAVDFDELLAELKTSLAENESVPDTRSRTELGAELKSMGLLDEAIRELQVAIREPNAPPEAYELLGESFIEKGQPRIAARLLAGAVAERGFGERESLGVLYQLGLAYEQLSDFENALDCYERIFSVDIDYRDIKERIMACAG